MGHQDTRRGVPVLKIRGAWRVLIADDEHLVAERLAAAVRHVGYEVAGAVADGEAAVALGEAERPDIALVDISMPGMNGLEAARILWEDHGVPSIVVTAYGDVAYVSQAARIGVFAYLLKPVEPEELRAAIEVALERARNHGDQEQRIEQLERTLAERRTVEQAKWRLIETRGMSEGEAHAFLQKEARATRQRIGDLARGVLGQDDGQAPQG